MRAEAIEQKHREVPIWVEVMTHCLLQSFRQASCRAQRRLLVGEKVTEQITFIMNLAPHTADGPVYGLPEQAFFMHGMRPFASLPAAYTRPGVDVAPAY